MAHRRNGSLHDVLPPKQRGAGGNSCPPLALSDARADSHQGIEWCQRLWKQVRPAPDCWLKAVDVLGVDIKKSVVFEDSVLGLKSGMASGAYVVGLTTTHDAKTIRPLCHYMINQISDLI